MLQRLLVGTLLIVFAGVLWLILMAAAAMLFDAAYWCVTSCWHQSSVRVAIAMGVPAVLSLVITYAVVASLRPSAETQKRKRR